MSYKKHLISGEGNLVVVIPCSSSWLDRALKTAEIVKQRAKYPCRVVVVEEGRFTDKEIDIAMANAFNLKNEEKWSGWIVAHNWACKNLEWEYYLYACADYFPGKDFVKIGMNALKKHNGGLFAFNDGKWGGLLATTGIVSKKWITGVYGDNIFNPIYKYHYADTELSLFAINDKKMVYSPSAVFMEVDYEDKCVNEEDRKKFNDQKKNFFNGKIRKELINVFG